MSHTVVEYDNLGWRVLVRGLLTTGSVCTYCGSLDIRPSRREPSVLTRLLQLRVFRCTACWHLFCLRHERTATEQPPT